MKTARWFTPLALSLILASPAIATHGGIHPTFRSQTVYFHCTGETPVQQINWLASIGSSSSYATWDTSPPPGSVTDGEGCGATDLGGASYDFLDPVFEGTFTGNLRDLTVRIYDFVLNSDRDPAAPVSLRVYAEIDGIAIFPAGTLETGGYAGRSLMVQPSRGDNAGLTDLLVFSITNIGYANEIRDAAGNLIDVETGGAALEDGNGECAHSIKLLLGLEEFPGSEPQTTGSEFWVWDTTEVPSGITFNPPDLAEATVAADLPEYDGLPEC